MFGIAMGAVFFGKPEAILLVALGSMIPDLDREYGLLSEDSFRRHQVHRALCHNFVFLALVYLVNPFLGIGAFLHTFLDALTTTKDRGVEWLYPFTRLVERSVYDSHGQKIPLDPKTKVYLYTNEPLALSQRSDPDLKPDSVPLPWRRTYGPGLGGRLLDTGIFAGSAALVLLLVLFSALHLHTFIDLAWHPVPLSYYLPVSIAILAGFANYAGGELDRRSTEKKEGPYRASLAYRVVWLLSNSMMAAAVVIAAVLNPAALSSVASEIPYVASASILLVAVAYGVLRYASTRPLPKVPKDEPTIV
jgi:hypothetical protein